MKIPKEIKLFNQTYKVVFDDDTARDKMVLGECDSNRNVIKLCANYEGEPVPKDKQFHVLIHEIAHLLFYHIGRSDFYEDEVLCDTLATAIEDLIINNNFR